MDDNKEINKELFDRMFKTIRTWEIKNVRNNEETDKNGRKNIKLHHKRSKIGGIV